jgi:hypothetical protein
MRLETSRIRACARIALVATTLGLSSLALPACGSDETPAEPNNNGGDTDAGADVVTCPGVIDDAGKCVAKCEDSMCNAGNYCVENTCRLVCSAHADCPTGYECTGKGKKDSDGSDVFYCAPDAQPMGEGEFLWPCPNGDECKADPAWMCMGVGPGDADAYCTRYDCHSDADCPGGMWCATIRDFHKVCGNDNIPMPGIDPEPGDCIDPASFTTDGKTYRLGPISLLRNVCVRRGYCAECDSDVDCSLNNGYVCVKADPNQKGYCSRSCTEAKQSCPWEGASTCAVVDPAKGDTCNPTYGACTGNGDPCTPCRNDEDCWDPSSPVRKACLRSSFSLEPYCVDLDTPCTTNTDCPTSPGGRRMQCLNSTDYKGSILYDRCYPSDNGLLTPGHPSCYKAP